MPKKPIIYEKCEMCYEKAAKKNGLCEECFVKTTAQWGTGYVEGERHYARNVGISREAFEEQGQRSAAYHYKRSSDQKKFLAGYMDCYSDCIVPLPNMVLEVHDGKSGWQVGEKFWTNDWRLARIEARSLISQPGRIPIEHFGE